MTCMGMRDNLKILSVPWILAVLGWGAFAGVFWHHVRGQNVAAVSADLWTRHSEITQSNQVLNALAIDMLESMDARLQAIEAQCGAH